MAATFLLNAPSGGQEACREYHNFKNFYSFVLMSMVDAKYRFVWGSCGYPGNSHDSIIFQSTAFWSSIKDGKFLPKSTQKEEGVSIPPLILGDSAFPLDALLCTLRVSLRFKTTYINYNVLYIYAFNSAHDKHDVKPNCRASVESSAK